MPTSHAPVMLPAWLFAPVGSGNSADVPVPWRTREGDTAAPVERTISESDASLVARVCGNDDADAHRAFEIIFRTYYHPLCDFVARYVGTPDATHEVVSGVFVRVWERRLAWIVRETLRGYLYTAVANAARNYRRQAVRAMRRAERSVADGDAPVWMGAPTSRPDDTAESADLNAQLWRVVRSLGDDGTVLMLRWRHGLDYAEIASVLSVSAGAAQRRHSRALGKLRAVLPDVFREEGNV